LILKDLKIEDNWNNELKDEFGKPYFIELNNYLTDLKSKGQNSYPPDSLIFNALNLTPYNKVKVIIIGQDPYHNPEQAMGLSFSVPKSQKIPPSLRNIYKELESDLSIEKPSHGDLTLWATQGVLLLNAMLTVQHKQPGSHKKIGWQTFTNSIITLLSNKKENLVFLLWGKFAQSKKTLIDTSKHLVLEAAHPSPLARNAFSGCRHFSKTNKYLISKHKNPINWNLA